MRIAEIAPPWFTVHPNAYGGTELVVSLEHEVEMLQRARAYLYAMVTAYEDIYRSITDA